MLGTAEIGFAAKGEPGHTSELLATNTQSGARTGSVLNVAQPSGMIPRAKMKVTSRFIDHRIPLSPEIAAELRQWKNVFGSKGYVFPSPLGANTSGANPSKRYTA
jgi:hypothetical protein